MHVSAILRSGNTVDCSGSATIDPLDKEVDDYLKKQFGLVNRTISRTTVWRWMKALGLDKGQELPTVSLFHSDD